LLYGGEFLRRTDVILKCEEAWWRGVRAFYGLPNGVSTVCLKLLFPRTSVANRVLTSKFSLLFRGTAKLSTLFPEAVVCDRGLLFAVHRQGYSRVLYEWCQFFKFGDAFEAVDMSVVRGVLATLRQTQMDSLWQQFSSMPSTAFAASVFSSPRGFYSSLLEASKFGLLGVRAVVLAVTGSLSVSYDRSRFCHRGEKFTFCHFLGCSLLGPGRSDSLRLAVECEDWRSVALTVLSRFELYLHISRSGHFREEQELFSLLARDESDSPVIAAMP
jgi:hypothetical protein